ncbi:MAG: electron transfer flavoprotein-ubiquinone oxidoreductase [Lentisphaerae bacterium]|nr:electron transfer flavoprotein-ubiquinone oxidoreductase [Lentisphaerota bacterium]
MNAIDCLIIGGGPAGLATAIRLKQRLTQAGREAAVVVVEKAARLGYHALSGGVFETACLDELVPGWAQLDDPFVTEMVRIEQDDLYFLTEKHAHLVPRSLVPAAMHHTGDAAISLSRLAAWLGKLAEREGVEIYTGFAAERLLLDGGAVRGVKLVDLGRGRDGTPKKNFLAGEEIEARVTVLADGARGVLSRQFVEAFGGGENPQIYSLGIKQLIKLPAGHAFGGKRVIHTLGYPNRPDVFGGGFLYSMGHDHVALGLILGLDWKYADLNGQLELEIFKGHPFMADLLKGGQVVAAGAKTIPEGGYYALPTLTADGGVLVGDAAGFVNMEKIKGLHYAIRSGMCAGDAIADALAQGNASKVALAGYRARLEERGILSDMKHARNYRQSFKHGTMAGAPLSLLQSWLPFRLAMEQDHLATRADARLNRVKTGMDKPQFTSLSGAMHREDEPPHLRILDPAACVECANVYGSPCVHFCPGEVYRMKGTEMIVSHTNCLHDGSCQVKCPMQNILWTVPEGGEGPRFRAM